MPTCKELVGSASDHLEGNTSLFQRLNFYLHIFICKHCRRYIQQLKLTIKVSKQSGSSPDISSDEIESIVSKLKQS
ncbi:MAG: hypothetical protein ACI9FB_003496 [Candidatus Azotimanducaceae bacterium]|jgi:hypothetical protein